jgi:hypothetical protein
MAMLNNQMVVWYLDPQCSIYGIFSNIYPLPMTQMCVKYSIHEANMGMYF